MNRILCLRLLPLFAALSLTACDCQTNSAIDPRSLVIEPASLTLTAGGLPGALTAHRVSGEDVTSQVTWTISDQAIARVEAGDLIALSAGPVVVRGLVAGNVVVTASLDEFTAGADVAVLPGPSCDDGLWNGEETDLDCGGACSPCALGGLCVSGADCASSSCVGGVCIPAATCSDGVRNGSESSPDCGGRQCLACGPGESCRAGGDCTSQVCLNGFCQPDTCLDGVRNGSETAIDCGGQRCNRCETGETCDTGADCASNLCVAGKCQAATCSDGVHNGAEVGLDCGGPDCASCGSVCTANSQCASGNCINGRCDDPVLAAVVVSPGAASVPLGRTQGFTARGQMSDGSTFDLTALATWISTDPSVALVNRLGVLQSLQQGVTRVNAVFGGLASNDVVVTVEAPALARIDLTPVGVRLPIGLVQVFEATGTFSDGSISDVTATATWSSGSQAIATIAANGWATAISQGTTVIRASVGAVTGTAALEVTDVYVSSIAVSPATSTLPVGVRAAFTATALLSDGTAREVTNEASWASTAPGVAQVSSIAPGLVTALGQGSTLITATLGGSSGAGLLTVLELTLASIQVFPADETMPQGFSLPYGAVGLYSDGNAYDLTLTATWNSTDPGVASVSNAFPSQGVVNTLTLGLTQIEARFGGQLGSTSLRVTDARLSSISVTPALLTLPIGVPRQYVATGVFDDGTARDVTQLVRWRSSNLAVASISNATNSRGVLTSLSAGESVVTAMLGNQVGTGQLRVTDATLETISISPPTPRIGIQGVVPFVATAVYTDGTALDVTELAAWTSSNTSVATVRNDTGYRGLAVGLNQGTSTIRATFASSFASATLTVTPATLNTLYISPAVVRTGLGIHVQFNASGYWSDGTTADLTRVATWTSSLSAVAVISNLAGSNGLATTRGQGVTTIRARWAGADDDTTLTVTNAALSSIAVTPAVTLTGMGVQVRYRAVATFSDGTTFDVTTNVAWSSSSPAVAAISGAPGTVGLATALSGGVTTITAQLGSISGGATLTVSSAPLVGVTVTPSSGIIPVNYWRQYVATAVFADGLAVDVTAQATWTTGSPAVANAGNGWLFGGRVTGLSPGSSPVVARFGPLGGSAAATVMALNLTDVEVTPHDPNSPLGVPVQLTATGTFSDGTTTIELDITLQVGWKVSPKKNGTVSNTDGSRGVVTMYNAGTSAVIHAQSPQPNTTAGDAHTKVSSP